MKQEEARVVTNTIKLLFETIGVNMSDNTPIELVYDMIEANYINDGAESVHEFVKYIIDNPKVSE